MVLSHYVMSITAQDSLYKVFPIWMIRLSLKIKEEQRYFFINNTAFHSM